MTVVDPAPTAPEGDQTSPQPGPARQAPEAIPRSDPRWREQIEWLGLPLALVADIAAAVYLTAKYWSLITIVAAIVIGFSGGFRLWRSRALPRRGWHVGVRERAASRRPRHPRIS